MVSVLLTAIECTTSLHDSGGTSRKNSKISMRTGYGDRYSLIINLEQLTLIMKKYVRHEILFYFYLIKIFHNHFSLLFHILYLYFIKSSFKLPLAPGTVSVPLEVISYILNNC